MLIRSVPSLWFGIFCCSLLLGVGIVELVNPSYTLAETEGPPGHPTCSDLLDNDGDCLIDGEDPGCSNQTCQEALDEANSGNCENEAMDAADQYANCIRSCPGCDSCRCNIYEAIPSCTPGIFALIDAGLGNSRFGPCFETCGDNSRFCFEQSTQDGSVCWQEIIDCINDCSCDTPCYWPGSCATDAEASVYGSPDGKRSMVVNNLAFLLIPVGTFIFLRIWRRKR